MDDRDFACRSLLMATPALLLSPASEGGLHWVRLAHCCYWIKLPIMNQISASAVPI